MSTGSGDNGKPRTEAKTEPKKTDDVAGATRQTDDVAGAARQTNDGAGASRRTDDVAGASRWMDEVAGASRWMDEVAGASGPMDEVAGASGPMDEVAGASRPTSHEEDVDAGLAAVTSAVATGAGMGVGDGEDEGDEPDPHDEELGPPPVQIGALAEGCVRFIAARYGVTLDFEPDTLSFVDQWVRDARAEMQRRPEAAELVQSSAGAYLGEVIRRSFGGEWALGGERGEPSAVAEWRLCMASVYCAFNPIGMVREALLLEPAEGWHAHFELDVAEREAIEARLESLPEVPDDEFFAPSTRYDVTEIVIAALQAAMQERRLTGVLFTPADYGLA